MFKAKLVENENYYNLRSKQLILMFLPSLPMGLIINFYQIPNWVTILMIGVYILTIILINKNQKRLSSMIENRSIEIDEKEIRIKSKNGTQKEIITLADIDKIIIKDTYSIPQETIKEIGKEMAGKAKKNYLILERNGQKRKLDFEITSYYMISQLNKIIANWKTIGYEIKSINYK